MEDQGPQTHEPIPVPTDLEDKAIQIIVDLMRERSKSQDQKFSESSTGVKARRTL